MITFNTDATLIFNIGIDIFSCIIILIIYFSFKNDFSDSYDNRLMCKLELSVLCVLITDIIMWTLNGKSGNLIHILSYLNSIVYYIMQIVTATIWLKYAWARIFGTGIRKKYEILCILIPLAIFSAIIISSPLTGLCFSIDEQNYYHRGIMSVPLSTCALFYMLSVSAVALMRSRNETLIDRKTELLAIAFFAVPPLLCGIAQIITYGLSLVWPSAVISSLFLLRNKENRTSLQDALTGLNNRRNLERFLSLYKDDFINHSVAILMLDLDDFKYINDQYGHASGDMALMELAHILRLSFKNKRAFLSRYGGDEFIVVILESDENSAEMSAQEIRRNCELFNSRGKLPFPISVSIGHATVEGKKDYNIGDLIKEADEHMYQNKALYHQKKRSANQ